MESREVCVDEMYLCLSLSFKGVYCLGCGFKHHHVFQLLPLFGGGWEMIQFDLQVFFFRWVGSTTS